MNKQTFTSVAALTVLALISGYAIYREMHHHGHGHDHGPDGSHADHAAHSPASAAPAADGIIRLTPAMVKNLGLQTAEVELRPIEKTIPALGRVEPEPGKVAALASRVSGRVTRLLVHDGKAVRTGDLLVEVESRVVADPPPRIPFVAPFDGVVLDVAVAPGSPVEPDRALLTVIDLSEVDVVAHVPEAQITAVRPGQTVHIHAIAHPDLVFTGRVKNTAARLDESGGALRVFVHLANPDAKLLPGMSARLAFVTDASPDAIVVPRAAVLGEGGDLFVIRQLGDEPTEFERTPVVVGLRDERFIEIIDGVLPGDRVVTQGNYPLQFVGGAAAAKLEDDHGHSHGPGGHSH
jgi:multidrug efflux pump subunit AcrA (membrane-fusion protein)